MLYYHHRNLTRSLPEGNSPEPVQHNAPVAVHSFDQFLNSPTPQPEVKEVPERELRHEDPLCEKTISA